MKLNLIIPLGFIALLCACTSNENASESAPCTEVIAVQGEAPSLLPSGKTFKLVWNDEFNGTALDESKWCYRTCFWMRKAHWFAEPEDGAVELKDGKAYLKIVKKADGQYVTPQLQTGHLIWDYVHDAKDSFWPISKMEKATYLHRYGYYECRCRTQQMPGWWSAFWMQSESQSTTADPAYSGIEHDIMESFVPGEVIPSCFHFGGYGSTLTTFCSPSKIDGKTAPSTKIDQTEFHTFGMLWEPDGYTVYIDGEPRGPKVGMNEKEGVSQVPEFILITTEGRSYREHNCTGSASPDLEKAWAAGDAFIVDYVRVFDIVD